jgi:protein phosphatase 1 regulatory subunit 7
MDKEKTPSPGESSNGGGKPHLTPTDSKGWDGKLRLERRPVLHNPEAISDPEYSDEEHVVPGEEISADEGELQNM